MIRNKNIIIKLCLRILLKGDTLKRVEFDEIFVVGTDDQLFLTCFINFFYWFTKMIDWQTCTCTFYVIWNTMDIVNYIHCITE